MFLISLKAGGFGLTLTEADYVFLLDPWWNPAAESQAVDRAHRIGQTRPVNVYRLIAAGTIEEKVMALQQRKARLFGAVMDDDALFSQALTADDIRGPLRRLNRASPGGPHGSGAAPRRRLESRSTREESMRITGLGHAGMFIETAGGSILCDPVIGPTFFGSWFPFPDNRGLDWETFGKADFLYISHRHRDHFDPALMHRYVPKDIKVLLPDYPTDDLEQDLRRLGYDNIVFTQAGVPLEFGELKLMVTPLRAPSDGPIGDSSLSVDDGTASILNQNDSHPLDLEKLLVVQQARGVLHAGRRARSGGRWSTTCRRSRSRTSRSSSATRRTSARCTTSRRWTPRTSSRWRDRRCSCATSCSATTGWGSRTTRSSPISASSSST